MAKYISMEELNKFPIRINHRDEENGKLDFVLGIETVFDYAESLPAADVVSKETHEAVVKALQAMAETDVVPVVRCKDCKLWQKSDAQMGDSLDDMQYVGGCEWAKYRRFENDFCSYGERKA